MENSDFASEEPYDDAICAAQDRLHAANQPGGDPKDRPRAYEELQRSKRAREEARKRAEQAEAAARPFPVDDLGPVLERAVHAIERKTMAPIELGVSSVLSAVALAVQGLANAVMPNGKEIPLSLFALSIAELTERKSSVDGYAMMPIRLEEADLRKQYRELREEYESDIATWTVEHNSILRSDAAPDTKKLQLRQIGPKPKVPPEPDLTVNSATIELMIYTFDVGRASVGIFSAEGSQMLSSHAFSKDKKSESLGFLCAMFSGEPYVRKTIAHKTQRVIDKRISLHLMIQPLYAKEALADAAMNDQGFLDAVSFASRTRALGRAS